MTCNSYSVRYYYKQFCSNEGNNYYQKNLPSGIQNVVLGNIAYSRPTSNCGGGNLKSDLSYSYDGGSGTINLVNNSVAPHFITNISLVCNDANRYDCVNGNCILSSTIPGLFGIYESLSDCQSVCSNGGSCGSGKKCVDINYCPPGKICIESGEYSEIQSLISKIKSENC